MSYDLRISTGEGSREQQLERLKDILRSYDAILVGAGAGLSTSAGLTYSGERFRKYFFDFAEKYGISDIYSGGFFPFPDEETRWAWWARHQMADWLCQYGYPERSDLRTVSIPGSDVESAI